MLRDYKLTSSEKCNRYFSESIKLKLVRELESGQLRPVDIHREYDVSYSSIYKWKSKYGMSKSKKKARLIVETESDTTKLQQLRKKIAELERLVGQKQIQLDFKEKMIELAEEHYRVDIKKKFIEGASSTTGKTDKNSK